MTTVPELVSINRLVRELLEKLDRAPFSRNIGISDLFREIDEIENQFDSLVSNLAPERITDERFTAAMNAIKEVGEKIEELRSLILKRKFRKAKRKVLDVQSAIRHAFRVLLMVKAGTPTYILMQTTPEFLRESYIRPPEDIVLSNPMAGQIYATLVRKGQATIEELARSLNIDDKTRDEFNRSISLLTQRGYVVTQIDKDGRMVLRPAR